MFYSLFFLSFQFPSLCSLTTTRVGFLRLRILPWILVAHTTLPFTFKSGNKGKTLLMKRRDGRRRDYTRVRGSCQTAWCFPQANWGVTDLRLVQDETADVMSYNIALYIASFKLS